MSQGTKYWWDTVEGHAAKYDVGKPFERRCISIVGKLVGPNNIEYEDESRTTGYDFRYYSANHQRVMSVECKCDAMAAKTGNIFIKTHLNGQAHGILTSTSDIWMIGVGNDGPILCVARLNLLEYLGTLQAEGKLRLLSGVGKCKDNQGYLVSVSVLEQCPGLFKIKESENG